MWKCSEQQSPAWELFTNIVGFSLMSLVERCSYECRSRLVNYSFMNYFNAGDLWLAIILHFEVFLLIVKTFLIKQFTELNYQFTYSHTQIQQISFDLVFLSSEKMKIPFDLVFKIGVFRLCSLGCRRGVKTMQRYFSEGMFNIKWLFFSFTMEDHNLYILLLNSKILCLFSRSFSDVFYSHVSGS